MARLNEPPAPIESIDGLKRRFLRQNREIARANSTQSLRIRSLESETSRLLSENLTLREQVIQLQQEAEDGYGRRAVDAMGCVKTKLAELNTLVAELGKVHKVTRKDGSSGRRRSERYSPKKSPDQRNWKNALTLLEVTGGQDGRLPAIVEDKYYPRRTLDSEELRDILTDPSTAIDSPELGPPPVAHFDEGDPVKHDHPQPSSTKNANEDLPSNALYANLEKRKKRRESSFSIGSTAVDSNRTKDSAQNLSTLHTAVSSQPLKSGAKRKLSARDDEENGNSTSSAEKEEFHFNRRREQPSESNRETGVRNKTLSGNTDGRKASTQDGAMARVSVTNKPREEANGVSAIRKALGEKSVNTDPVVSPMKVTKATSGDKANEMKKDVSRKHRDRDQFRDKPSSTRMLRQTDIVSQPLFASIDPPAIISLPPATPAIPEDDIFSPTSSVPSATQTSKDTPPPSSDIAAATTRPTRRPRSGVSYAEPNLRDKMRRPTKELVDAVGADERVQRAGSIKPEILKPGDDDVVITSVGLAKETVQGKGRTVVIKKEGAVTNVDANDWKMLPLRAPRDNSSAKAGTTDPPASPLDRKASTTFTSDTDGAKLPASVLTERRRRTSTFERSDAHDLAPNHRTHNGPALDPPTRFKSSSSSSSTIAALVAGPHAPTQRKAATRTRDRTDAPPSSSSSDIYTFHDSPHEAEDPATAGKLSRRYSSVPERLNAVVGAAAGEKKADRDMGARARVGGRRDELLGGDVGGGRAERAAGRRRSMML